MIKQKLQTDQIQSLKTGDRKKLEILRYILAQIKNKEIDKKDDLNDEEVVLTLRRIAKELKESIEAFKKGKRDDLIAQSKNQLEIVLSYLPAEISDEELKKEIDKIISQNKDLYQKDPKTIIGICMKVLKSKADPSRIILILQSIK